VCGVVSQQAAFLQLLHGQVCCGDGGQQHLTRHHQRTKLLQRHPQHLQHTSSSSSSTQLSHSVMSTHYVTHNAQSCRTCSCQQQKNLAREGQQHRAQATWPQHTAIQLRSRQPQCKLGVLAASCQLVATVRLLLTGTSLPGAPSCDQLQLCHWNNRQGRVGAGCVVHACTPQAPPTSMLASSASLLPGLGSGCGSIARKGTKRFMHHLTSGRPAWSGGSSRCHSPPANHAWTMIAAAAAAAVGENCASTGMLPAC